MIPAYDKNGNLPHGRLPYICTWAEFSERYGYNKQRLHLLKELRAVCNQLRNAGCRWFYVDGSFITNKLAPRDWDACWDPSGVDLDQLDNKFHSDLFRNQVKHEYSGDLFVLLPRLPGGNWVAWWQQDRRTGFRKGILKMDLGTLP